MRQFCLKLPLFIVVMCLLGAPVAVADWDEGDGFKMHFPQLPNPDGWDVGFGQGIADDWQCTQTGFVDDIHIWCSFHADDVVELPTIDVVIFSDNPSGTGGWSEPNQQLWHRQFSLADGDYTVRLYDSGDQGYLYYYDPDKPPLTLPHDHKKYYQINITDIQDPWEQEEGTIYWLFVYVNPNIDVGWKTSLDHFNDGAVWWDTETAGWFPANDPCTGEPLDYAFVITSESMELEYCDAPEGYSAVAYPSTGVTGAFPTCVTSGPAGFVQHNNWGAWLGPAFDFETDGDAGLCPPPGCFPPYDVDECYADGDAGLTIPEPYTIDAFGNVVPCPLSPTGTALGQVCQWAVWGTDIDIDVHNHMPGATIGYVNLLVDWVQDGDWGDTAWCGPAPVSEHVLQNFQIPNPFDGAISTLMPFGAAFQIGPNPGYVWARVSITEVRVPVPWDGSGVFEDGESEAYLIRVDPCNLDWGDAPDYTPGGLGYPTLSTNNGANHVIQGPWLGDTTDSPDPDPDGQPDPTATGDDGDVDGDDEDGVSVPVLKVGQTDNITFEVNGGGGQVNIWIDWNSDMDWDDAGEKVEDLWYADGVYNLPVTPPATSVIGQTFLRARISTDGSLPPGGAASDGEVEDHEVWIEQPEEYDFGDAPDPPYPTWLLASNGARHLIDRRMYLGSSVDSEADGQPDPWATGDDLDGNDDEDGVSFASWLIPGQWAQVDVTPTLDGFIDAWIDFNGDGSWVGPMDRIFAAEPVSGGAVNSLWFFVPFGATPNIGTFARFRYSSVGGLPFDGAATDGEVEDYQVHIEENEMIKWIQRPDTSPNGIDIKVDGGLWLADDFECTQYGLITDVHLWGSWKYDEDGYINRLHLSIHSDDPRGPGGSDPYNKYSKPDKLLWARDFWPGEFEMYWVGTLPEPEYWWDPTPLGGLTYPGDRQLWRIDVYIDPCTAFVQEGDPCEPVIYWLDVHADTEYGEFGWKTRRFPEQYMDDAVYHYGELPFLWEELRYPPEHPYYPNSIDMAFALTGIELKPPVKHLKWSQPPIEIDPNYYRDPIYCGWNQPSWQMEETLVYEDTNDAHYYYMAFMGDTVADDMNLAGTERELVHYDFDVSCDVAPYTVTSELYTDSGGLPGLPIPGTSCVHNVAVTGLVTLDCAPGPGAVLPDKVWMVLASSEPNTGWYIAETAEVGYTADVFAWDDGMGWVAGDFGGVPYAGMWGHIWCRSLQAYGVADDFRCLGRMPIESVHYWGSYQYWDIPEPPPMQPKGWLFKFWTNVPADPAVDPNFSHPGDLLHEVYVPHDRVKTEWVGWDEFPDMPFEACFQHYVEFEGDEVFWQGHYPDVTPDNIFWLGITAVYPNNVSMPYPWGWKTRPWSWMDDAVEYECREVPPDEVVCQYWPLEGLGESFDVAFELDTDPNYIKWEQPFTGIRRWHLYHDELSMMTVEPEIKWIQHPNTALPGLHAHDWLEIPSGYRYITLADDWECRGGDVMDLHWYGNYELDAAQQEIRGAGIRDFKLSIHDCGGGVPYCLPAEPPVREVNVPFAVVSEVDTGLVNNEGCKIYRYSYYLPDPFIQEAGQFYWFDITAISVDAGNPPMWRWQEANRTTSFLGHAPAAQKTERTPWQSIVWGVDPERFSDMAFAVTSGPGEPNIIRLVADDWPCERHTPIVAIGWWGSYIGYRYQACAPAVTPRPVKPDYFWLAIWDDVPAGVDPAYTFSHPNNIIWEYKTHDYDEVLVGYDKYPLGEPGPREPVFRYSVRLPETAWFHQKDVNGVYWLSVVAVYDQNTPNYDWGWTNHKHVYNDDAVAGSVDPGGPVPAWRWVELYDQSGMSEDMSFILFTEPGCFPSSYSTYWDWLALGKPNCWCGIYLNPPDWLYQCEGDTANDAQVIGWRVYTNDLTILANNWKKMINDPTLNPCADIDHKPQVIGWRCYTNDLTIMSNNWKKTAAQLPGNCPRPE